MRKALAVLLAGTAVLLLAGLAFAQMGPWREHGWGQPGPGWGPMGPGMGWGQTAPATPITEENAKQLAQQYVDRYLRGFSVDKVLPFAESYGTAYSVELKGPQDEVRILHVSPWGDVMPVGGPWQRPS